MDTIIIIVVETMGFFGHRNSNYVNFVCGARAEIEFNVRCCGSSYINNIDTRKLNSTQLLDWSGWNAVVPVAHCNSFYCIVFSRIAINIWSHSISSESFSSACNSGRNLTRQLTRLYYESKNKYICSLPVWTCINKRKTTNNTEIHWKQNIKRIIWFTL